MKKLLTLSLPLCLSIILFYFFGKNLNFQAIWLEIVHADYLLLILSGLLLLASHYLRALRWTYLVNPFFESRATFRFLISFLAGTLSNFVVPHSGDIIRCNILNKLTDAPTSKVIGTVVSERIIDSIIIAILGLVFVLISHDAFSFQKAIQFKLDYYFSKNVPDLIFYLFFAIIVIIVVVFFVKKYFKNRKPLAAISVFFSNLKAGMSSFSKMNNKIQFTIISIIIWILYFLATWVIVHAIPVGKAVDFTMILGVLVMASLGWALPTQGGVGGFHILVSKLLIAMGIASQFSFVIALFLHAVYTFFDIGFGLIALGIFYFNVFGLKSKKDANYSLKLRIGVF